MARTLHSYYAEGNTTPDAKLNVSCELPPKGTFSKETNMNRFKNLLTIAAFSLLVLGLPSLASAQWGNRDRDRDRDDDNYGRNNGYYNNSQLKNTIKRLKNDSKDFAKFVDRDLDNSRYNGRNREDSINQLARDFKDATNRLENRFGNGRNLNDSSNEAQNVLSIANQLERALNRARLSSNVEDYWYNNIQSQLREISNAYGYRNNNNRNRGNNNGNNGGGWRNRFPFPF
jgi:hypothetical protein